MGRFSVAIVGYGTNPHARCFEDFARALAGALRDLGHEVVPHNDARPGRLIMLGANNFTDAAGVMPEDAIAFNTEQIAVLGVEGQFNVDTYRKRVVWEYSEANAAKLRAAGLERVVMCPLGYHASMQRFQQAPESEKGVDVLHVGSMSERRLEVLRAIEAAGLTVRQLFNAYGEERDKLIARAKVVLNWHYYENGVFEIFRVSHLVANRACVVSEASGADAALNDLCSRICCTVEGEDTAGVVGLCKQLVDHPSYRSSIADLAYDEFRTTSLAESVRRALEESR